MKRYTLRIEEKRANFLDFKIFNISFKASLLGIETQTFDLRSFHRRGYLAQFIRNFKKEQEICVMFFLSIFLKKEELPKEKLSWLISLANSSIKLVQYFPEKKMWGVKRGKVAYLLVLEDKNIRNVSEIIEGIDIGKSLIYFIFEDVSRKDILCKKLEGFWQGNALEERNILSLSVEFFKLTFTEEEEEFKVFSSRWDREGLKNILLGSTFVDADKFEVLLK